MISQRRYDDKYGQACDALEYAYVELLSEFNINVLPVANAPLDVVQRYLNETPVIDGVILSGGEDIDQKYFTAPGASNFMRESTETALLNYAVNNHKPVLGICRGLQFINLYFGGTNIKNIKTTISEDHDAGVMHEVCLVENVKTSLSANNKVILNSYHNQGVHIDGLSTDLEKFAWTSGGIIEGLYHPKLPIAAVQSHPEREDEVSELSALLINSFRSRKLFWG